MCAKYGSSLIPNDSVFLWMVVVVDFFFFLKTLGSFLQQALDCVP